MQQLQLDSVRVVEEERVVAGRVVILKRPALDRRALFDEPARALVYDFAGGDVEADVMHADRVPIVGEPMTQRRYRGQLGKANVVAMDLLAVIREGEGPEVLLVHGGASPRTTWSALSPLGARWTLALVHRRGYPPSPSPAGGRQDFEVDATDLAALLESPVHIVAHSYGVLGTLIAAARVPACVRSLTLIEPPLYYLVPADEGVARLRRLGDAVLIDGLNADAATLREFLRLAGAPDVEDGPLPDDVARGVRRAHGGRLPGEARPALANIRDAQIPVLVASGCHAPALERICDALAATLRGERVVAPGAGHFVAAAPGFGARLESFLLASG
jgi:pimeloyl-ACP methyl ester carboxylesterase